MTDKYCGNCDYAPDFLSDKRRVSGECFFAPPVVVVRIEARHFHDDIGPRCDPARTQSVRPMVNRYDKCGQWKEVENTNNLDSEEHF